MKTIPATKRKPKARTVTADSPLPYPAYKQGGHYPSEDFRCWIYWWFCELSQAAALRDLARKLNGKTPALTHDALWAGARYCTEQSEISLKYIVSSGGLLCAWAGTTALEVLA